MANQSIVNQDMHVRGTFSCERLVAPAGSISNDAIGAAAGVADSKLQHRHVLVHSQIEIAAATQNLLAMRFDGEVLAIEAAITDAIVADRTITIDLQKSTGGGAFASILSTELVLDDASVLRELVAGVIQDADLLAGDILRLTVVVAFGLVVSGAGLLVTVTVRENAQ